MQKMAKATGESVWDHIFYFVRGFPYNGIDLGKEEAFKNVNGNYLLFSVIISGVLVGLLNTGNSKHDNRDIGMAIWSGVLTAIILTIVLLVAKFAPSMTGIEIQNNTTFSFISGTLYTLIIVISIIII